MGDIARRCFACHHPVEPTARRNPRRRWLRDAYWCDGCRTTIPTSGTYITVAPAPSQALDWARDEAAIQPTPPAGRDGEAFRRWVEREYGQIPEYQRAWLGAGWMARAAAAPAPDAEAVRAAALEEAARVCEGHARRARACGGRYRGEQEGADACAMKIRALKCKEQTDAE